jgi:conjugative relaxase-like TrwC/TraI family protein
MVSIGVIGGAVGGARSASYYTSSVAKGRDDYYTGKGEAPGEWFGAGAQALGLAGEIDAGQFHKVVMEAVDPVSGEQLRRPARDRPVHGVDMTFSAPKSVSLVYFLGGEQAQAAVRQAHDEAVMAGLGYMEREACVVRDGKGGSKGKQVAQGFVGGVFRHRTSRALDPQLHTHAVVANLAKRADGAYVALDATAIYQQAKTAGYLYQAELRARLAEYLGVEWGEVRNGTAEIKGVPVAVIEHFSKRRAQIVEAMDERGAHSARSAQDAALETRPEKAAAELSELVGEWRAVAAELGLAEADVEALTARIAERPVPAGAELAQLGEKLAGDRGLTERASTFDRRAVIQAMAEGHTYGATVARVEGLTDRFLDSRHVLAVEGEPALAGPDTLRRGDGSLLVRPTGEKYTTPELLACEAALVAGAQRRAGEGAGTVDADTVGRAIAARATLGADQAEMVRSLTRCGAGVQVVRAPAGTGKTYALDAAREAWAESGYRVVGATVAARAKVELAAQAGIESWTIAGLLNGFDRGDGLAAHNVLVVDEAGMVATRQIARLAEECARAGAKLVLVGDDRQLPEIDAGGAFRGLADRLGACELTESRRLIDTAEFALQQELRAGRPAGWLDFADERGRLVLEQGHDATCARLVSDWAQGSAELAAAALDRDASEAEAEAVMLAPTRDAAAELNVRAQAYARDAGRLGEQALELGGVRYSEGDRVICLRNRERDIGVLNGQRGTVTALEPGSFSLRVDIDGHGERVLPASYIEDGHLTLGYAMTVHKSQGMTADRTYVLGSEDQYRELGYTALSRHRDECRFYVNAGEPEAGQVELEVSGDHRAAVRKRLERTLGRSRAELMALDVHENDQDLRHLSHTELAARSGRLEELLASFPAEVRHADRQAAELARDAERIRAGEQRLAAQEAQRAELGVLERRRKAELDKWIARDQQVLANNRAAHGELAATVGAGQVAGEQWLERHGVELAEATVIEHELAARRARALEDAIARAVHDPSEDLVDRIGARPAALVESERWDKAAAALEGYRHRYEQLPGPDRPADPGERRAWEHTAETVAPLAPDGPPDVELADLGPELDFD